jgi:hypothetical protein
MVAATNSPFEFVVGFEKRPRRDKALAVATDLRTLQ